MQKSTHDIIRETGLNNGLINKKKPGNPLAKYSNKKKFEYKNMKLRIENELLKKGYLMTG